VFKFAETIVSQAMFVDRGERDHAEFLHESWGILLDAVKHAAHATQILADAYICRRSGGAARLYTVFSKYEGEGEQERSNVIAAHSSRSTFSPCQFPFRQ